MARKGGDNLKRGNQQPGDKQPWKPGPQPHGGFMAPPPTDGSRFEAERERTKALHKSVLEDPNASLEEIHAQLTIWVTRIVKRGARSAAPPDPTTMQVIREFRQVLEALNEYRRTRGAITEASDFFDALDERVGTLMKLAPEPVPVVEPE